MDGTRLSEKSAEILGMIAQGRSYGQIVNGQPDISYLDIFMAAKEALSLCQGPRAGEGRLLAIRSKHARAYERWEPEEDELLLTLQGTEPSILAIAKRLKRQPSAIRSRLAKLELQQFLGKEPT